MTKNKVFPPPPHIATKDLILKSIELSDAERMFNSYSQDIDVARYMSWPIPKHFNETLDFVKSAVENWQTPSDCPDFVYSIFENKSKEFVGCCSIGPHGSNNYFNWGVGYNLAKKFWGRGYATQAVNAISNSIFDRPEIFRISALVDIENPASAKVLEKCGFKNEGILKKYSIHPNTGSDPRDVFSYAKTK